LQHRPEEDTVPHGDRIVAIGLLTKRDLDVLGTGFRRMFPLQQTADFDDLIDQLNNLTSSRPRDRDRPN
jgi:hypothetical protein